MLQIVGVASPSFRIELTARCWCTVFYSQLTSKVIHARSVQAVVYLERPVVSFEYFVSSIVRNNRLYINFDFTAKIGCCLKKVTKEVDKFDDTLKKVHNASNRKRKQKYVEDLKKKSKKLQPLQNQIKTWIATPEIKDKSVLVEKLKLIDYVIAF